MTRPVLGTIAALACLGLAAGLDGACSEDPLADCVKLCAHGALCPQAASPPNCPAACQEQIAFASELGCSSEYADLVSCFSGLSVDDLCGNSIQHNPTACTHTVNPYNTCIARTCPDPFHCQVPSTSSASGG